MSELPSSLNDKTLKELKDDLDWFAEIQERHHFFGYRPSSIRLRLEDAYKKRLRRLS